MVLMYGLKGCQLLFEKRRNEGILCVHVCKCLAAALISGGCDGEFPLFPL